MKEFENPTLKTEHVNVDGVKMTLVLDNDGNRFVHHPACDDDFLPLNEIRNSSEMYLSLNMEERFVFTAFISVCDFIFDDKDNVRWSRKN
ncbi:MAG: hypothetical protein AABY15_03090 [Nanoarchaeota archaeon]